MTVRLKMEKIEQALGEYDSRRKGPKRAEAA
jgi:hypothetical protein